MTARPIKLFWWQGDGAHDVSRRNFGDYLSPLIVEMVSRRPVVFAPVASADMLAIGTILKRERQARLFGFPRKLHIWGSGAGKPDERFPARHYYHAVRGHLTLARIKATGGASPALGDPGILAGRYVDGRQAPDKTFTLGIIPHFVDQSLKAVTEIGSRPNTLVINVFDPVDSVLEQIRRCHFILSSSMHGLIVSDAFGIPNRRILLSDKVKSSMKFEDYYSIYGLQEPQPLTPAEVLDPRFKLDLIAESYARPGLQTLQDRLAAAFPDL